MMLRVDSTVRVEPLNAADALISTATASDTSRADSEPAGENITAYFSYEYALAASVSASR
jgi:hypothetical protein